MYPESQVLDSHPALTPPRPGERISERSQERQRQRSRAEPFYDDGGRSSSSMRFSLACTVTGGGETIIPTPNGVFILVA